MKVTRWCSPEVPKKSAEECLPEHHVQEGFLLQGTSPAVPAYRTNHYSLHCFICMVINRLKILSILLPHIPDQFSMTMPFLHEAQFARTINCRRSQLLVLNWHTISAWGTVVENCKLNITWTWTFRILIAFRSAHLGAHPTDTISVANGTCWKESYSRCYAPCPATLSYYFCSFFLVLTTLEFPISFLIMP